MLRPLHRLTILLACFPCTRLVAQTPLCVGPMRSTAPLTANQASTLALHCGDEGRVRLAARYGDDRGAARARELDLVNILLGVRHPAVFAAAERLLADRRAGTALRLGAIAVLMRQWREDLAIGMDELPRLLRGELVECRPSAGRTYGYFVREALPADSAERIARALTLAADEPGELRALARCAGERLGVR